ncbi:hypothetical protein EII25_01140 [Erysipelotrichaceae bacterium OH741_COT-311]|nr:hypothetical protein EII25_01140 [Erysipelotrichaceae bacterium OH741_COT-311]
MIKLLKLFKVVLMVGILLTLFPQQTIYANTDQDVQMDIITRDKDNKGNSVYSYLTGMEIRAQADILVSGPKIYYPKGQLIIRVPKSTTNGLQIKKPNFVSSIEAISSVESQDATHYVMTYTFKEIKGGLLGTYDFPLRFENEITANGDTITPSWEMVDADGNVIKKVERTFTAIASSDWEPLKWLNEWDYAFNGAYNTSSIGNPEKDGYKELRRTYIDQKAPTVTSSDGTGFAVKYYVDARFAPKNGTDTQFGIYNAQTVTFVDTLPQGAVLDDVSVRNGWVYDPLTHTASKTVDITKLQDLGNNRKGIRTWIQIKYANEPVDKVQKNNLKIIMDKDLPNEKISSDVHYNIKFKLLEQKSQTPTGHIRTGRSYLDTHAEKTYVYNPDTQKVNSRSGEEVEGLTYITYFLNENNGMWNGSNNTKTTGGIKTEFSEFTFHNLDSRLYFNKLGIYSFNGHGNDVKTIFNNTENEVYGVKSDGTQVLLKRNLRIPDASVDNRTVIPNDASEVIINDKAREYHKIVIKFPNKIVFNNSWVRFYNIVSPVENELKKFKNFEYKDKQRYELSASAKARELTGTAIVARKDNAGNWQLDPNTPAGVTINPITGQIKVPQSLVVENSPIVANSFYKNVTTYKTVQQPNMKTTAMPIIHFKEDMTTEILPPVHHTDVDKMEVKYVHPILGEKQLIVSKANGYWSFVNEVEAGVSIDSVSGAITIKADGIVSDSTIKGKAFIGNQEGNEAFSRTPFKNQNQNLEIRPTSAITSYNDADGFVIEPYADNRTDRIEIDYEAVDNSVNTASFADRNEYYTGNHWDVIEFPWIKAKLNHGDNHTVYYSSAPKANYRELYIQGSMGGSWTTSNFNANFTMITLLPSGVNFVEHSRLTSQRNAKDNQNPPIIEENFRGTGRTAVIYKFNGTKLPNLDDTSYFDGSYSGSYFKVDVTTLANEGDNLVEHFLYWDKDHIIQPSDSAYVDALDLDGDGNTNETFIRKTNRITLILPNEVTGKKQVSLDKQNWVLNAPPQDIGKDVYYKLNVLNNSIRGLDKFKLIDVLPAINDHNITPNDQGIYVPRGTKIVTPLVEGIETVAENAPYLNDWNFYYSITEQGADFDSVLHAQWLTADQITDWNDVKAIKAEVKPGRVFASKSEINFILHARIPYDKTLENNLPAHNSFAISTLGVNYAEANEAVVSNIRYEVNGVIFFDKNRNAKLDSDEIPLNGYKVELVNEQGMPYIDRDGKPIFAYTNEQGYYQMNVFERGNYSVKIHKKYEDERFLDRVYEIDTTDANGQPIKQAKPGTTISNNKGVIGSDATANADNLTANTPVFALNPVTRIGTRNAAVGISKGEIVVLKKDEQGKLLQGVTFELYKDQQLLASKTTDENGTIIFERLDLNQEYKVVEKETLPQYVLDSQEYLVTPNEDKPFPIITIENKVKRGSVTVVKKDRETNEVIEGAIFTLTNDSHHYEATSNQQGIARFDGVLYGEYTLQEVKPALGYNLAQEVRQVRVIEDGKVVEVGDYFNDVIKGNVVVMKQARTIEPLKQRGVFAVEANQDVEVETYLNKELEGTLVFKKINPLTKDPIKDFVFTITSLDGVTTYSATTNDQGIATFQNINKNYYKLEETTILYDNNTNKGVSAIYEVEKQDVGPYLEKELEGTVKFKKVDPITNVPMANVGYRLVSKDKTKEYNAVSNAEGIVEFNHVEYAVYDLIEEVEVNTSESVKLVNAIVDVEDTNTHKYLKQKIHGNLTVKKVHPDTKLPVKNFELKLVSVYGTNTYSATTNEEGIAVFEDIISNYYDLQEVNIASASRSIEDGVTIVNHEGITLEEFLANPLTEDLIIKKVNPANGLPIVNMEVQLVSVDGTKTYKATTDEEGFASFTGVANKQYTYVEKMILNPSNLVEDGVSLIYKEEMDLTTYLANDISGNVTLIKYKADGSEVISNKSLYLEHKADQTRYEALTDAKGVATFTGIPLGSYKVLEVNPIATYETGNDGISIFIRNEDNIETYLTKEVEGRVIIKKLNPETNQPIANAVFNLISLDNTTTLTATTNLDGLAIFEGVPLNSYRIERNLEKELKDTAPIEGVIFLLEQVVVQPNGTSVKTGLTYAAKTDKDGVASFKDVRYGNYIIREVAEYEINGVLEHSPKEYTISKEERSVFVNKQGQLIQAGDVYDRNGNLVDAGDVYINRQVRGTIRFQKQDVDTQDVLENAVFKIQNTVSGYTQQATSNEKGIVVFTDVPYGEYKLVEIQAPTGYVVSSEERLVSIVNHNDIVELNAFYNSPIKANVKFRKLDGESNVPLANAKFQLQHVDPRFVYEAISDSEGWVEFSQIRYGFYTLMELEAPVGYIHNPEKIGVVVQENGVTITLDHFYNMPIKGSAFLIKVDSATGQTLKGATFLLRKDGVDLQEVKSDEHGEVVFHNLYYGEYEIVEKEAPQGYYVNSEVKKVKITENGQMYDLGKFKNIKIVIVDPEEEEFHIPKTMNTTRAFPYILMFGLSLSVLIYIVLKKQYSHTKKQV